VATWRCFSLELCMLQHRIVYERLHSIVYFWRSDPTLVSAGIAWQSGNARRNRQHVSALGDGCPPALAWNLTAPWAVPCLLHEVRGESVETDTHLLWLLRERARAWRRRRGGSRCRRPAVSLAGRVTHRQSVSARCRKWVGAWRLVALLASLICAFRGRDEPVPEPEERPRRQPRHSESNQPAPSPPSVS